jgi:hypothetical protein
MVMGELLAPVLIGMLGEGIAQDAGELGRAAAPLGLGGKRGSSIMDESPIASKSGVQSLSARTMVS